MNQEQIEQAAVDYFNRRDGNFGLKDLETFYYAVQWALSHQYVSVEDALPMESGDYLVTLKEPVFGEAYFHEISTYDKKENKWNFVGKLIVTHWMPIPSLEGGEE